MSQTCRPKIFEIYRNSLMQCNKHPLRTASSTFPLLSSSFLILFACDPPSYVFSSADRGLSEEEDPESPRALGAGQDAHSGG